MTSINSILRYGVHGPVSPFAFCFDSGPEPQPLWNFKQALDEETSRTWAHESGVSPVQEECVRADKSTMSSSTFFLLYYYYRFRSFFIVIIRLAIAVFDHIVVVAFSEFKRTGECGRKIGRQCSVCCAAKLKNMKWRQKSPWTPQIVEQPRWVWWLKRGWFFPTLDWHRAEQLPTKPDHFDHPEHFRQVYHSHGNNARLYQLSLFVKGKRCVEDSGWLDNAA